MGADYAVGVQARGPVPGGSPDKPTLISRHQLK